MIDTEDRLAVIEDALGLYLDGYHNIGSPSRDAEIDELKERIDDLERDLAKLIARSIGAAGEA